MYNSHKEQLFKNVIMYTTQKSDHDHSMTPNQTDSSKEMRTLTKPGLETKPSYFLV